MSFRRLLAVLLMLWLPIQTASAVIMPFCKHALRSHGGLLVQQVDAHAPTVDAERCAAHAGDQQSSTAAHGNLASCDQCELCHLACAGFLASSVAPLAAPAMSAAVASEPAPFHSVTPSLQQRPPMPVSS